MHAARLKRAKASLMRQRSRWSFIASGHFPARHRSYSRTLWCGMMQAVPAIQPTPPINITAAGICAESRENLHARRSVHDGQQPLGIGRCVLDVADTRVLSEAGDHIERKVAALKLRIGIEY